MQSGDLEEVGCSKIFKNIVSGAKVDRKGLGHCSSYLREGDTLVVWKVDRLGRFLKDLIAQITKLEELGVGFYSITENLDTTTVG